MQFNLTKCVVLTVTNKSSPITSQYKLYDHLLAHVSEAKYLGLTLDKNLNFNDTIVCLCSPCRNEAIQEAFQVQSYKPQINSM